MPLQREMQCLWQKLIAKAAKAGNRQTIPEFGVSRILELLLKAVGKTGVTRRKSSPLPYLCLLLKKQIFAAFLKQTVPEFGASRILEFCAFAEKNAVSLANQGCKGGQNVGRNDRLWHLKSRYLPKAPSQSPRIQLALNSVIRMPISNKEGTAYGGPGVLWHKIMYGKFSIKGTAYGGPGVLWHLKSPALPKPSSQSHRIQLALNSDTDCRFHRRKRIPRRKPANHPRIRRKPNSGAFAQGSG